MDSEAEIKLATETLSGLKEQIDSIIETESAQGNVLHAFSLLQNSQRT